MGDTAKKTAAKKTAAAAENKEQPPAEATSATSATAEPGATVAPAGSGDSGPGTDTAAPAEDSARYPEATLADGLNPPTDAKDQSEPKEGHTLSSTDHTYAAAGGRTIAGEEFDSLVDEKGKAVKVDSIFDDGDGTKGFVTVKKRVYERFYYPNTTEVASRLLFVEGQRVNRAEAARITATIKG